MGQKTKNKVCKCQGLTEPIIEWFIKAPLCSGWLRFEEGDYGQGSLTSLKIKRDLYIMHGFPKHTHRGQKTFFL